MELLNLRLKDFIGIKKGLGLDHISIDFSNMKGLVVLCGKNGSGKTTVLDCCHPYAMLGSRKGKLQAHTYGRNAEKELRFSLNGNEYKTLLKIDAEKSHIEGYVWKNGTAEVDGKITNYRKYIEKLLGSSELFFNSSFCSQNAKKLNELTTGKLKELFSEFLRLDKLIAHEDTAKQCSSIFTSRKAAITSDFEQIQIQISKFGDPEADLVETKQDKDNAKKKIKELEKDLEGLEFELSALQERMQKIESIKVSRETIRKDIHRITAAVVLDAEQQDREIEALRIKYLGAKEDGAAMDKILKNEKGIRQAAKEAERVDAVIGAYNSVIALSESAYVLAVDAASKKKTDLNDVKMSYKDRLNDEDNALVLLEQKLKTARISASDLDKRDPDCQSTTCSFIVRALESQKTIRKIEEATEAHSGNKAFIERQFHGAIDRISAESEELVASVAKKKTEKDELLAKRANQERILGSLKALAAKLPGVLDAETRKTGVERLTKEIAVEGQRIKDIWTKRIKSQESQKKSAEFSLSDIDKELGLIPECNKDPILIKIEATKSGLTQTTSEFVSASSREAVLQTEIVSQKQAVEKLANKKKELERVMSELSDWEYLRDACGKKGLRALEIDSVAPVITADANNLLIATFGPAYTIRFRTQDDEGREILDIVTICEDGSEVPLDFLSGGQKVWLLKALRLSMSLISKRKSGIEILSGFADELDGPLDATRAVEFTQLYRAFMKAGGFKSFYFISHKNECQCLADHRIVFGDGQVTIE